MKTYRRGAEGRRGLLPSLRPSASSAPLRSTFSTLATLLLLLTACATAPPPEPRPVGAGFRYSAYGPKFNPGPEYWALVGFDMARRFENAHPETIWIVSRLQGQGTLLNFPATAKDNLITGSLVDENEETLDLFDRLGVKVWLQIEPGYASVDELIDIILERYKHHPSVIGFGLDVEWYRSNNPDEGEPVSDEVARRWVSAVRKHNPNYRLFLKHFALDKMPPRERDGLVFVDDSQIFPSFDAMVAEFETWGRTFAPAPVGFQYGYPSDRPWWSRLADPPGDIGRAIRSRVPNTEGLYWVDFTVLDVFPPVAGLRAGATSLPADTGKYEGLALTPPMGWNSWNHFGCNVDEKLIRETVDAIVASGMKDAGYQYVNIDDCWHGERDEKGFIRPDPQRFPSGMKALGDYIHSKGLKFGIYSDAGWKTCGGRPGSRGFEAQDAKTYAEWGVDYLKYDWCNTEGLSAPGAYLTMSRALRAAGRPIVLSICEWGDNKPWEWGKTIGHLWRTTGDITNCFDCIVDHGTWKSWGVLQILDRQPGLRRHAGPDHWNDPDMMEVGNGMSVAEDRAHFSMWAMLAAPLIAGNDVRKMSAATRDILINRDVIAVNQDVDGFQAFRHRTTGSLEVWAKPLAGGDWAIAMLNRGTVPIDVNFDWTTPAIADDLSSRKFQGIYTIHDLWTKQTRGDTSANFVAQVPPHDVILLRLKEKR